MDSVTLAGDPGVTKPPAALRSVNICGAGHSGSPLVGLLLDSHSACFYMGEGGKVRYLGDERRALRKRVCKICGTDCPLWSRFEWDPALPLYTQLARATDRAVIVDSTKNVAWIRERSAEVVAAGGTAVLLLLTRDGRAVINSRLRKYPDRDAEQQIRDWMEQLERSRELYSQHSGPRMEIRYEELATSPERVLGDLCNLLGIRFEPAMLNFEEFDHHPLGGNSGTQYQVARSRFPDPANAFVTLGQRSRAYYEDHPRGIRLDLRWRQELAAEHLALFEHLAGSFNESLQWED